MIDFGPLWETIVKKHSTQTELLKKQVVGGGTLQRMRNNQSVSTDTINSLCNALRCKPSDIMRYTPDQTQGPD